VCHLPEDDNHQLKGCKSSTVILHMDNQESTLVCFQLCFCDKCLYAGSCTCFVMWKNVNIQDQNFAPRLR
jgi:hypothetical protein